MLATIYVILGIVGAVSHWGKKRYVDKTTTDSFKDYMVNNLPATFYSFSAIVFAEVNLSLLQTETTIHLANVIGALTLGYSADSGINKSSEAPMVAIVVKDLETTK